MKTYEEMAKAVLEARDEYIIKKRKRVTILKRTSAFAFGAAAVIGIGICANVLSPPKRPQSESSSVIAETTSSETSVATAVTSEITEKTASETIPAPLSTAPKTSQSRTTAVTVRTSAETASLTVRTSVSSAQTAVVTQAETSRIQTVSTSSVPQTTVTETSVPSIDRRIANISISLPYFDDVLKQTPVISENGKKLPTFAMLVDENDYECIISYEKGELPFSLDLNGDGKVDLYDMFELAVYSLCGEDELEDAFPDMNICDRIEDIPCVDDEYVVSDMMRIFPEYMIFTGENIPDAQTVESSLKKYAENRSVPDNTAEMVCETTQNIQEDYDSRYWKRYERINRPVDFSETYLDIFRRLDSGELLPDFDCDGDADYMDVYGMLKYYADVCTGQSGLYSEEEHKRINESCNLIDAPNDRGRTDSDDAAVLMSYLFNYKGEDYVTCIEAELEYLKSDSV